jgi:small subunit ribosomal protein S1
MEKSRELLQMSPSESSQIPESVSDQPTDTQSPAAGVSFGDVLRQFEQEHQAAGGNAALSGTIVSVSDDTIVVDVGRKMEGILQPGPNIPADVKVGDLVLVNITGRTEDGSYYTLSTIRVERPRDFSALQAAFNEKKIIAGRVTEPVKGGLRVDIGVPAFLPASRSGVREVPELEKLVGEEIQVRITKLDLSNPERPDAVVDRRSVLEEETARTKQEAFAKLSEGMVVDATVRTLTDFGAFLEIMPGVDGLLHVTDMSWQRVDKPSSILVNGQKLQVKILKINADSRKISLGLKQLAPDPWAAAIENFKAGDRVRGKVVRLADFGAFIEIQPGVDGLIHLSEMSYTKRIRKPADMLTIGEEVEAVILGVQPAEKRISLGLKQALGNPWDDVEQKYPIGAVVEGPVTSLAQFGAFVTLGDGLDGMIHIADISRDKRLQHPKEELTLGQVVKAKVLEVDKAKRRIRLGMKQLQPTSADLFIQEHKPGDELTGRIVDVRALEAKVELGEGVNAHCRLAPPPEAPKPAAAPSGGSLEDWTAMLTQKWKSGGTAFSTEKTKEGGVRSGQIRKFRILTIDPEAKRIEVELAD